MSEGQFLGLLHRANLNAMEMGQLAKANAGSGDVKDYAERIVRDHRVADAVVIQFAKETGIQMRPPRGTEALRQVDAKASEQLDNLGGLKGTDFDREFLRNLAADHETLIREVGAGRDRFHASAVVSLIDALLPMLRDHLGSAQKLQRGLDASAREKSM